MDASRPKRGIVFYAATMAYLNVTGDHANSLPPLLIAQGGTEKAPT